MLPCIIGSIVCLIGLVCSRSIARDTADEGDDFDSSLEAPAAPRQPVPVMTSEHQMPSNFYGQPTQGSYGSVEKKTVAPAERQPASLYTVPRSYPSHSHSQSHIERASSKHHQRSIPNPLLG